MKMLLGIFSLLAIVSLGESVVEPPLIVGTWNLQRLGQTKMGKPEVVSVMVQVLRRYDIVSVLEVRDSSEETPVLLLNALNEGLAGDEQYSLALSQRVGRGSQKEQYAVYYKASRVTFLKDYQYPDTTDRFEYDPYVVEFGLPTLQKFELISIHVKPSDAVVEINELANVYDFYKGLTKDIMILGDFNAGCSYVSASDWASIALRTNPNFDWLITDHADTNVASTNCPYDRIVINGDGLKDVSYAGSAKAFYFDEELGITDGELVADVSDHYPVEVFLRMSPKAIDNALPTTSIGVEFVASAQTLANLQSMSSGTQACDSGQDLLSLKGQVANEAAAEEAILYYKSTLELPESAVSVLLHKLQNGGLSDPTLYGETPIAQLYTIWILCFTSQSSCSLSVTIPTPVS